MTSFSERIRTRQRLWWGNPNRWRRRDTYRHLLHRFNEHRVLRRHDDPESLWHCCELWQRTLHNKWNAREFARKHGCRVPALYWCGRRIGALRFDSLPGHFVIRPTWGTGRGGVHVMADGRDLLHERAYTPEQLVAEVRREQGRVSRYPILVEEFVETEAGDQVLPLEFKCYTFGATIAAIQVIQRNGRQAWTWFYTPAWEPFDDPMTTKVPQGPGSIDPPRCLDEIVANAKALGTAYGTFVRVDFFATERGCVFGEFSGSPAAGQQFTDFADRYFGELWDEVFPDRT